MTNSRQAKTVGIVAKAASISSSVLALRMRTGCGGGTAGGDDHRHLAANEVGGHFRQLVIAIAAPAIFDGDVFALDIAGFGEAILESGDEVGHCDRGSGIEKSDHRHRRLLRPRRERPCGCRAAEQRDELAPAT